jgi:glycosyltransferase involved in cell wall biosynthesis
MRILLWHGWLLEGSGSNVFTARVARELRERGHDVLLLCQDQHPERSAFVDAWGVIDEGGVLELKPNSVEPAAGRVVALRPLIGPVLPVFVIDEYEGFDRVERFIDLSNDELGAYLERNVGALKAAAEWHGSEVFIVGHAVPGPIVARRALGPGRYVAAVHGSDLEYAINQQHRYAELARDGLEGAIAVVGASGDVLARACAVAQAIAARTRVVFAGVDVDQFLPKPRAAALTEVSELLAAHTESARGRPTSLDTEIDRALVARQTAALDTLAHRYDQTVPDADVSARLARLTTYQGPLIGYFGKLIPQKGVERLLEGLALLAPRVRGVIVGCGLFREWLEALAIALDRGDVTAARWLADMSGMQLDLERETAAPSGLLRCLDFTGFLDHRYAPYVLAALDILVVPSTVKEAFGMVAAEGAAAGAIPLVARHSGLAEVAAALEDAVDRPGLLSFEPGYGATHRLVAGIERILRLPPPERSLLRQKVAAYVAAEWTWARTVDRLLAAAAPGHDRTSHG